MKVICWNCRGLGRLRAVRSLAELVRSSKPQILGLIETKLDPKRVEGIRRKLGFHNGLAVDRDGLSGGIAICWKEDVNLFVSNYSRNHIDCIVDGVTKSRLTIFYGNPVAHKRADSWELLRSLRSLSDLPWLVFGDFNEVLFSWESIGVRRRCEWQMRRFREVIEECGLLDLGFKGSKFTFSNRRVGDMEAKARLDRAFGNEEWRKIHPDSEVSHLISSVSDHLPLLVDSSKKSIISKKKLFRFEPMWLRHGEYADLISRGWCDANRPGGLIHKLKTCKSLLARWNVKTFGKVNKHISRLKQELEKVRHMFRTTEIIEKEAELCRELEEWLAREELLWRQRSRVEWLKEGDANTKFFHQRASQRKKRNSIDRIKAANGVWISDGTEICKSAMIYYANLYQKNIQEEVPNWREALAVIDKKVSEDACLQLSAPFTAVEVQDAIFQLGPTKAPGLDGFSAIFFQKDWDLVKRDVTDFALKFLNEGIIDPGVNETLITLVPKVKDPETFNEFRPISLVSVTMKIITKAMANRLKNVLPHIISVSQSAFIPGRLISDNILLAHEVMHYIKTRGATDAEYCCIKLDMSKAFDRIDWRYLEEVQLQLGFPSVWVKKVMQCVTTVSYRVRINDLISDAFRPEKGLRQGDPLSPYLFVICTEWLAKTLEWHQNHNLLKGVKISRRAPMISNLMFADDSIFFIRADTDDIFRFKSILKRYEELSGQLVNYNKSELCMGNNVDINKAGALSSILGVKIVHKIEKYLGLPICFSNKKIELFSFVENRIWKKINGWKEKLLSAAGKEILIKSVVQAIPIYAMSCYKLPSSLCDKLSSIVVKYWWNDAKNKRYISWASRKDLCRPKLEGGMGFKVFNWVNDALLIKQAARILTNPDLLISSIYQAKYFPHGDIFSSRLGSRPSWAWRSLFNVLHMLGNWASPSLSSHGVTWCFNEGKPLLVKQIYTHLAEQQQQKYNDVSGEPSDKRPLKEFWKRVWRVKAQEKVKIFVWKLFKNALPSCLNLIRRGCEVDPKCIRCGFSYESTAHVFLHCWWSKEFWKQLLCDTVPVMEWQFTNMADWLWYCVNEYDKEVLILIFYGARWIWFTRNSLWHNGEFYNISDVVMKAKAQIKDILRPDFKFVVSRCEPAVQWQPPVADYLKINCDGAWDPITGAGGLGFICRDNMGRAQFAAACKKECFRDVIEAECAAIYLAMQEAAKRDIYKVIFASDSAESIQALLGCQRYQGIHSEWTLKCRSLLNKYENWRLEHVLRDGNAVADMLAHKAFSTGWCWTSPTAIPICIAQAVKSDMYVAESV